MDRTVTGCSEELDVVRVKPDECDIEEGIVLPEGSHHLVPEDGEEARQPGAPLVDRRPDDQT